jgi:acyl-CoA synthetase (AMP-forming)/AMP-acid ligase II
MRMVIWWTAPTRWERSRSEPHGDPVLSGNPRSARIPRSDGYLHTQDVARIGELGYLQITDRVKDVIETGGEWISSRDLEAVISRYPRSWSTKKRLWEEHGG